MFVLDGSLQGANDGFPLGRCRIAFLDLLRPARGHDPPVVGTVLVRQLPVLRVKVVIGLADHLFGRHPEIAGKVLVARQVDGITVLMEHPLGKVVEQGPVSEVTFLQGRPAFGGLLREAAPRIGIGPSSDAPVIC